MDEGYPTWFCPVFLCNFSTSYCNNIKEHLVSVHSWDPGSADDVVDDFYEAYRSGADRVNNKALEDPTNPDNWSGMTVSSRDLSRRSVVVGGGGVG